jgi:hypothetical protein
MTNIRKKIPLLFHPLKMSNNISLNYSEIVYRVTLNILVLFHFVMDLCCLLG